MSHNINDFLKFAFGIAIGYGFYHFLVNPKVKQIEAERIQAVVAGVRG